MVANAIFGRADLHDDVATALEMVRRQSAFAGIHPASGAGRAARQRAHRRRRNRAETHAADVDDLMRFKRIPAIAFSDQQRRRRQPFLFQHGEGMVHKNDGTRLAQVVGGPEADNAALILGFLVGPSRAWRWLNGISARSPAKSLAVSPRFSKGTRPMTGKLRRTVCFLGNVVNDEYDQCASQHKAKNRADAVGHHANHAVHPPPFGVRIIINIEEIHGFDIRNIVYDLMHGSRAGLGEH